MHQDIGNRIYVCVYSKDLRNKLILSYKIFNSVIPAFSKHTSREIVGKTEMKLTKLSLVTSLFSLFF